MCSFGPNPLKPTVKITQLPLLLPHETLQSSAANLNASTISCMLRVLHVTAPHVFNSAPGGRRAQVTHGHGLLGAQQGRFENPLGFWCIHVGMSAVERTGHRSEDSPWRGPIIPLAFGRTVFDASTGIAVRRRTAQVGKSTRARTLALKRAMLRQRLTRF